MTDSDNIQLLQDELDKCNQVLQAKPDSIYFANRIKELKAELKRLGVKPSKPVQKAKQVTGKESGMVSSSTLVSPK